MFPVAFIEVVHILHTNHDLHNTCIYLACVFRCYVFRFHISRGSSIPSNSSQGSLYHQIISSTNDPDMITHLQSSLTITMLLSLDVDLWWHMVVTHMCGRCFHWAHTLCCDPIGYWHLLMMDDDVWLDGDLLYLSPTCGTSKSQFSNMYPTRVAILHNLMHVGAT